MVDDIMEQAVRMVIVQTGCSSQREAWSYLESRAIATDQTIEQVAVEVVDGKYVFPHQ